MHLSIFGRTFHAVLAVSQLFLLAQAVRGGDTVGAIFWAAFAIIFGVPALMERDALSAYSVPVPRWLRWMFKPAPRGE